MRRSRAIQRWRTGTLELPLDDDASALSRSLMERTIDLVTIEGVLAPGEVFSEDAISEKLELSGDEGPLREALGLLVKDGIAGVRPGLGHWIWPVSVSEARSFLKQRATLEQEVFAYVARSGRSISVAEPSELLGDIQLAPTDAWFAKLEARLHSSLVNAAGFPYAYELVKSWGYQLRIARRSRPYMTDERGALTGNLRRLITTFEHGSGASEIAAVIEAQLEIALIGFNSRGINDRPGASMC